MFVFLSPEIDWEQNCSKQKDDIENLVPNSDLSIPNGKLI
jgi:hypothetical protein